jgi:hypothetical protein
MEYDNNHFIIASRAYSLHFGGQLHCPAGRKGCRAVAPSLLRLRLGSLPSPHSMWSSSPVVVLMAGIRASSVVLELVDARDQIMFCV